MKKVFIAALSGVILFAACDNTNSPSVGTYEKETSQSTEQKEGTAKEGHGTVNHEKAKPAEEVGGDTSKTHVNVDKGGSEFRSSEDSVSTKTKTTKVTKH